MYTWHTRVSRASRIAFGTVFFFGATLGLSGASAFASTTDSADLPAEKEQRDGPPGDNGTVKVHDPDTAPDDMRNEPHVCEFTVVGSHFDSAQKVWWKIREWPPGESAKKRPVVLEGDLVLDDEGHGSTETHTLPDGHYKLFWNFDGENGHAKQKVFWVDCETEETPDEDAKESDEGTEKDQGKGGKDEETPSKPDGKDKGEPEESEKDEADTPSPTPEAEAGQPDAEDASPAPASEPETDEEKADTASTGGLPVTGAALGGLVAAAVVAIAGGGVAMFYARKRKAAADGAVAEESAES
ncbi:hypothetical protein CDO52_09255 [Nocardiopsis gilva YIM 90087]|uniref:LPXTG cell wall anchor domain-containing protein n=1 Tax=Nocardiopsis gilva YIM 90087 TaxID=1235441 RepID=A0A223S4A1_9ACTN|nr:hypothetical protein [Nocardiopsis gilva]ASU82954.1 hypothetical protein CDO52_09255 [Nocardiopsis gilva YIM 90087]